MRAFGLGSHGFLGLTLLILATATAHAVPVTTCGATLARGQTGELVADLDCSSSPGVCLQPGPGGAFVTCTNDAECAPTGVAVCARSGVVLESGARLDLGGHVLTGAGVRCADKGVCTVRNGEIAGAAAGVLAGAKVIAADLSVHDCVFGVQSRRTVRATGVTVTGCSADAVNGALGVRAESSSAVGNGGSGFTAGRGTFKGVNVVASGNFHGVDARTASAKNLTATGNTEVGVITVRGLTLIDSTVTGNGVPGAGPDVESQEGRVRLRNTTCDHGASPAHPGDGPLCALD